MLLGQAVGGQKDEYLDSKMAKKGEDGLDRQGRLVYCFQKQLKSCLIKCEFVLLGWADDVKEVMKNNCGNCQTFQDRRIADIVIG